MTILDHTKNVGKVGLYCADDGLAYPVEIIDIKTRWGNIDYVIRPVNGLGSKAVTHQKISIN